MICIIDCTKYTMPVWKPIEILNNYTTCSENELLETKGIVMLDIGKLSANCKKIIHQKYTLIAPILLYATDKKKRTEIINNISIANKISKQSIRNYLCLYLVYQDIVIFTPKNSITGKYFTVDQKNMRWALNKFF